MDLSTVKLIVSGIAAIAVFVTTVYTMQEQMADDRAEHQRFEDIVIEMLEEIETNKASNVQVEIIRAETTRRIGNAMDRAETNRERIEGREGINERLLRLEIGGN